MNQRMVTGLLTAGCIALAGAGYMTYYKEMQTNTIIFLWRLVNYEKQFSTRIQSSYDQRYDT